MNPSSPLSEPPGWSERIYIRIPRQEIAFFKCVLESVHNLALMTVVDKYEAVLMLWYAPGQEREVRRFVNGMAREMPLEILNLGSIPS